MRVDTLPVRELRIEVLLNGRTLGSVATGIDPAADDEQRMHATIALPIRQELEARLANRPVGGDERRHNVLGTIAVATVTCGLTGGDDPPCVG